MIVHDITDPYFAEVVRGVEDGGAGAGYLVITCSSERDAERERSYVRLLRSIRAAAVVFAGSGLDDPTLNAEIERHLAAMRADGAAVVHLSPHALGEPEVSVDNAGGHRRDGRPRSSGSAIAGSPSWPGRGRCTSRASGSPATGAAWPTPASRSTSGWSSHTGFDRDGRRAGRGRAARPAMRRSPRSAAPTTCSRSARSSAWPSSGSTSPARSRSPASTTSRRRRMTAPSLSTVRLPLRELGRRGFEHADRLLAGRGRPRRSADRGRPARVDRCATGT